MAHCSRWRESTGPVHDHGPEPAAARRAGTARRPRRRGSARATLQKRSAAHPPGHGDAVDRAACAGPRHGRIPPALAARTRRRRRLADAAPGAAAGGTLAGRSRHPAGPPEPGRAADARRSAPSRLDTRASWRWMCSTGWRDPTTRAGMSSSPICSCITFRQASWRGCCAGIAARTRVFLCCEPRRSALPLAGSHLVGLLGAGPVTRQDAVSSVHAGFRAQELSDLWPDSAGLGVGRVSGGACSATVSLPSGKSGK